MLLILTMSAAKKIGDLESFDQSCTNFTLNISFSFLFYRNKTSGEVCGKHHV